MVTKSSVTIYASKINFLLVGGLAFLGILVSLVTLNAGYLGLSVLFLIIGFPVLFTRIIYNGVHIKQVNIFGSRTILFETVVRYTYGNQFLTDGSRWVKIDLKSYEQYAVEELHHFTRVRLGKEAESRTIQTAAREMLHSVSNQSEWRRYSREFSALVKSYDELPIVHITNSGPNLHLFHSEFEHIHLGGHP